MNTQNKLQFLKTPYEVVEHWPFFLEGLKRIEENSMGKAEVDPDSFLRILLRIVDEGEEYGVVVLVRNKNDKLVGFAVLRDNTDWLFVKSAVMYAAYSVGNNTSITKDMSILGMEWCKKHGYKMLYALSLRTGAAIKRLYCKKWGFKLHGLWFRKDVE